MLTYLESLRVVESDGLGEELHVDVADPVGAALPLPDHLDIEVVEAVPVELGHPAYVPLVHLLVGPAAPHRHPGLYDSLCNSLHDSCDSLPGCGPGCRRRSRRWT